MPAGACTPTASGTCAVSMCCASAIRQPCWTQTLGIARRCTFDLGQLRYQYPRELVPEGHSAASWLRN